MIPAMGTDGKILMDSKSSIKLVPNGNGAFFDAFDKDPVLQKRLDSVEFLQIIGVDNVLNKVLDPYFFGYAKKQGHEACMKSCIKRNAEEKVGVAATLNG